MTRREKKSETLEIRLPYTQKQAFMAACRERGVTASDTLRRLIDEEMTPVSEGRSWARTLRRNPLKAAASFVGTALAAVTFSTGASFAEDDVFDRLDRDSDGVVTYEEFEKGLQQGDRAEVETKVELRNGQTASVRSYDPQEAETAERLFSGMDDDDNSVLTAGELEGEGSFVRRSIHLDTTGEERSTVITVELVEYDLTVPGRQSISVTAESRALEGEREQDELIGLLEALEEEVRAGR
jgi:hypothetical protein